MADESEKPGRTKRGTFAKGTSGNPGGKRKERADSAAPATPAKKPFRRLDSGWSNFFTGHGVYGVDKRQGTSFKAATLTFDMLNDLWRGDDLAARAVEILPKEALRERYDLIIPEDDEDADGDESDRIAEVMDKLDVLGADYAIRVGLNYERGMGGGAVLIGANDGETDLTKPLNYDKIRSLDWLTPLEPREIYPIYGYADPRAPKFGQPEIYRLTSRYVLPPVSGQYTQAVMDIHESRLLTFPGIRVSRFQNLAAQGGWGDSVLVRMWRVLRDFNLAWGSAGVLVSEFASAVYKMKDLWETLATADGNVLFAERLAAMDLAKSTINATVIDADDDYKREQTPISGLPDLLDKFSTRLAAAADMPLTLLFGTSPAGLSATGESDIRFFYDRVAAYQREKVLPQLQQLIKIIFRTTGSKKEPAKWSVRFRPLWQESAADKAKAMFTQAQADHIWITDQVLSAEEVADAHWGAGEWNPDLTVDFDAREKQEAAAAGPVTEDDLRAMGRLPPEYVPPPPQGSFEPAPLTTPRGEPAQPDPNTPPKPFVQGTGDSAEFGRYDFDESEARDESGRWSGGGSGAGKSAASRLARQAKEAGWFTYDPKTGEQPHSGYAVSVHPGHEVKLAGKDALDPKHIKDYVDARRDVFDRDPGARVGGWYNPDDDTWYLDVSHVERDLDDAVRLGQAHNQLGIYDLKRGETINAHEYESALARRGKFAGRTDAAPQPGTGRAAGPAPHVARGDRQGDAGAPGQGAPRARLARVARYDGVADDVNEQLKDDYDPQTRKWILDTHWSGPERVQLSDIDYSKRKNWRATKEPDKVKRFKKRIGRGWEKPIILARLPGKDKHMVVDGHHRALAYRALERAPLAYVAHPDRPNGPWDEFHSQQHEKRSDAADPEFRVDDFDESQHPRDEGGKFAPSGSAGGAKVKSSLGTVGKAREALASTHSAPRWKSGEAQNTRAREADKQASQRAKDVQAAAKAQGWDPKAAAAQMEAARHEHRSGAKEAYAAEVEARERGFASTMSPTAYRERQQQMRANIEADKYREAEKPQSTLPGQQSMALAKPGTAEREEHQRVKEALRNNAKQGSAQRPEQDVVSSVKAHIAEEREHDRQRAEKAAAMEKAAQEREAKLKPLREAADKKVADAVAAQEAAERAYAEEYAKHGTLGSKLDNLAILRENAEADVRNAKAERKAVEPKSPQRTSSQENISTLKSREVTEAKRLGGGANTSKVAVLDDGTKAVYKPAEGEEPNLRNNIEAGTYYLREAAASNVAEALGVADLVPATVVHDGPDGVGSLQAWVPDSQPLSYTSAMFDRDAAERMRVFDYVTGNSDRHEGNVMVVEKDGKTLPILIDNGLAFPNGGPDRFIQPVDSIPREPLSSATERMVNSFDHVKIAATLARSGIEETAVRQVVARAERLKHEPEILDADVGAPHITNDSAYAWDDMAHESLRGYKDHVDEVMAHPTVRAAFKEAGR